MPPCPYPPSAPTPRLPDEPGDHDEPLPGLTATPHRHNPYPEPRTPALPPTATITLHRTTAGTLTGHASGARHQWAETCLTLAGFTADQYGIHQLPLDDPSQAREALHQLRQSAQDLDVAVILSERPFLGDVADRIAHALPGRWTVIVTAHPERHAQQGLLESVWASGPSGGALHKALETSHPSVSAHLRHDGDGAWLVLVHDAWHAHYVVGAMLPGPDELDTVASEGPACVTAPTIEAIAAAVRDRLLPDYAAALLRGQLAEAEEDLRWAQETYEPGEILEPFDPALAGALARFLNQVPHLIAHVRRPQALQLSPHETAFLDSFEATLESDGQDGTVAMSLWLTEGDQLIDLARNPDRPRLAPPPATRRVPGPAPVLSAARSR